MNRNQNTLIHVEDLTMAYQDSPVLFDVDLDIPENTRCAIVGPNGAGKSTLLKGILSLIKPVSGSISIYGKSFNDVRDKIAYVPQIGSVNWDFPTTVLDVVQMGRYNKLGWIRQPGKKEREIAESALDEMKLSDFADRQISQLSGGQRQRVFIARAIAQDAQLYIMDEPLAGVDETTERIIMDKFIEFQKNGKSIIAVHHDLNTLESYFDYLVILNRTIKAVGPMETTFTKENIKLAYR